MQKAIIIAIIVGVVFVAGVSALVIFGGGVANSALDDKRIILFYSNDCSHCANVEKFMQDNNTESKLNIVKLELSDEANAKNLVEKARYCRIQTKDVGIPFLWYGFDENQPDSRCLTGDTDIINFLKKF